MKQTVKRRRVKLWIQDLGAVAVITGAIGIVGHLDWMGFDLSRKPCWPLIFGLLALMALGMLVFDPDDPRHQDPPDWDDEDDWEDSEF